MPIRINFLAEHYAEEEQRRRDPVKRATLGAIVFIALLVFWGAYLQIRLLAAGSDVSSSEAKFKQIEARYREAQANQAAVDSAQRRIDALHQLASVRVLWAGSLHAMQYTAMDDVALMQLRTDQSYVVTQATPPKTNTTGVTAGVIARSRERATVFLEARDSGPRPGELIAQFQERIASQPFFKTNLGEIRLVARSPVQNESEPGSRPFVTFALECIFAERER